MRLSGFATGISIENRMCSNSLVINVLDYDFIISEFKLHIHYYAYFRTYIDGDIIITIIIGFLV